jgi:hypothetical protein
MTYAIAIQAVTLETDPRDSRAECTCVLGDPILHFGSALLIHCFADADASLFLRPGVGDQSPEQ